MIIQCIHCIHSPEGNNNMSRFAPALSSQLPGARVDLFEYGFMGFWRARWDNDEVAARLAATHKANSGGEMSIWITHSNGAAVAYLAWKKYGVKPDMVINFNPALDRWLTIIGAQVETIHSDGDRAVWWSQWLPGHIWGDQGKVGYRGSKGKVVNFNASKFGGRMAYQDHMGAFTSQRISHWAGFVAGRIEQQYQLYRGPKA